MKQYNWGEVVSFRFGYCIMAVCSHLDTYKYMHE